MHTARFVSSQFNFDRTTCICSFYGLYFFFVYSKAEGIHEIGRRSSGDTLNVTECVCVERVITGQKDGHKIV